MLGLGWTEMLVIGVAALIFIGPKDLPIVMKRLGQITGQIRRMGNEFQREINKTTGLDEVRNLRNAITAPLKQTTDQIRKDFNAMTATGEIKPSGIIKPADPKVESVVNEIHAAAGMTPPAPTPTAPVTSKPVKAAVAAKKPAAKKAPAKAKAAPTAPVVTAELAPVTAPATPAKPKAAPRKAAAKPAVAATTAAAPAAVAADTTAPVPQAPKKRAAAKKPATPAAKAGTE